MKKSHDLTKSAAPTFEPNDRVWLSARNIRTRRQLKKLDHKFLGPFKVLEPIGQLAYRLALPKEMKIHPVFHVSLLQRHQASSLANCVPPPPPPVVVDDAEEYEVDEILDSQVFRGKPRYRVRWKNYSPSGDSL
ncbi:hypothetical protein JCM11491_002518, partial [Sporobolomyces phaffii]